MSQVTDQKIIQLILTLATILGGGAGMVGWAYETFEAKDVSRERQTSLEKRLERIEQKLDQALERIARPERTGH